MTLPGDLRHAVLHCIDLEYAIDHPSLSIRNNPDAAQTIATLQAAWRAQGVAERRGAVQYAETVHALSRPHMDREDCTVMMAQKVLAGI